MFSGSLMHKVGELKIRETPRAEQKRLGPSFDLRAFHDRLLSFGSVPLSLLEESFGGNAIGN